jgi:hypothetical protein
VERQSAALRVAALPTAVDIRKEEHFGAPIRRRRDVDEAPVRCTPDAIELTLDEDIGFLAEAPAVLKRAALPPDDFPNVVEGIIGLTVNPRLDRYELGLAGSIDLPCKLEGIPADLKRIH